MAVPFYIPEEDESSVMQGGEASAASSSNTTPAASPSRPIPIPLRSNPQSPQSSPIDNEVLVQAFYEALCRCSQGSPMSPPMSPSSPLSQGQFFFSHMMHTPSTSAFSSPRHSFRQPRRRLNSQGSYAQESDAEDEEEAQQPQPHMNDWDNHYTNREQLEEFSGRVPQPKKKRSPSNQKPKTKSDKSKITNFVISALQYVIDTLR